MVFNHWIEVRVLWRTLEFFQTKHNYVCYALGRFFAWNRFKSLILSEEKIVMLYQTKTIHTQFCFQFYGNR